MRKIAIIETVGGHGGMECYLYGLCTALIQSKFEPILYTCDETYIEDAPCQVKLNFQKIYSDAPALLRGVRFFFGLIKTLLDCIKHKPDIVHTHVFHFNALEYFLITLCKIVGFKVVITVHDVECFEKYSKGQKQVTNYERLLKKGSVIIVHTEFAKKKLLEKIPSFTDNIFVVPGYDADSKTLLAHRKIAKKEAREKVNLPNDRKIILFLGQIKKVKGLDVLIDSFAQVALKQKNAILVIVGKVWKDTFDDYERQIKNNAIINKVITRIEYIPNDEVPLYMKSADILALPYIKVYNSGVLIRSMSLGVPLICSDTGPFPEFVEHGKNGFIYENKNTSHMADILIEALKQKGKLKAIGHNAAETFDRLFSFERVGKKMEDVYLTALHQR